MNRLNHNCERDGCPDPLEHYREIYLAETSFQSYTPIGPDSNWVGGKYRHNEHVVEYELCHRKIVDEKLILESPTNPFFSKDVPSNDHLSNPISVDSSEHLSHDILPSESNLNTAIHHDSDGFSDSDDDWMIATTNLPKPDEIKRHIPKPDIPQPELDRKSGNMQVIDLESLQGTKKKQTPKTTPKRANESMKQFLKNHKKKSTSPKNRAGPSKLRSNEGQPKTKVQRLKHDDVKATSDADSWDSDFYQNCKNASQDKNHATKPPDNNIEEIKDHNLEKDSSSSSLIKDTSGNLFGDSNDDFDSDNDEDFLELTRTRIEHSEEPEKSNVKKTNEQKNDVIVIDSD